jgi:DNA-binding phage protein
MLTTTGNPTYSSLIGILRAVGLKIAIQPDGSAPTPAPPK